MKQAGQFSDQIIRPFGRWWRRNSFALLTGVAVTMAGVALLLSGTSRAQQTYTGQWRIEAKPQPEKVSLSLRYRAAKNKSGDDSVFNSNTTFDIDLAQLSGLKQAQVTSANGEHVEFQLRRDPGNLHFEGWFKDGRGAGDFLFSPSTTFAGQLTKRGFQAPSPEQQFMLAVHGIDLAYVDELRNHGYQQTTLEELVRLGTHGVGRDYIRELRTLGHDVKTADLLIKMVDHGVSLRFIRNLAALGYEKTPPEELIRAVDHGVTADFVKTLQATAYPKLSLDQLVRAVDHGVNSKFVQELAELGYQRLTVDQLIQMVDHGVRPRFIRELKAFGYENVSVDLLVRLVDHGVSAAFIQKVRRSVYKNQSLEQMIIYAIGAMTLTEERSRDAWRGEILHQFAANLFHTFTSPSLRTSSFTFI